MLESIAGAAKTGATIIGYGGLLAIGFWGARQITNVADEAILSYRIRKQQEKDAKTAAATPAQADPDPNNIADTI